MPPLQISLIPRIQVRRFHRLSERLDIDGSQLPRLAESMKNHHYGRFLTQPVKEIEAPQ